MIFVVGCITQQMQTNKLLQSLFISENSETLFKILLFFLLFLSASFTVNKTQKQQIFKICRLIWVLSFVHNNEFTE